MLLTYKKHTDIITYIKLSIKLQITYGGAFMLKTIAVRGKKDIVAVFVKYAQISGQQDTSRPKATADFIDYVSKMALNEKTVVKLKNASKQRIDESEISEDSVPSSIKIPVDIDELTWEKAMSVFKYAFSLKGNPQMPYFLRVAGMAYINELEEQESGIVANIQKISDKTKIDSIMTFEEFKSLDIDDKLIEIYKLLIERNV